MKLIQLLLVFFCWPMYVITLLSEVVWVGSIVSETIFAGAASSGLTFMIFMFDVTHSLDATFLEQVTASFWLYLCFGFGWVLCIGIGRAIDSVLSILNFDFDRIVKVCWELAIAFCNKLGQMVE